MDASMRSMKEAGTVSVSLVSASITLFRSRIYATTLHNHPVMGHKPLVKFSCDNSTLLMRTHYDSSTTLMSAYCQGQLEQAYGSQATSSFKTSPPGDVLIQNLTARRRAHSQAHLLGALSVKAGFRCERRPQLDVIVDAASGQNCDTTQLSLACIAARAEHECTRQSHATIT